MKQKLYELLNYVDTDYGKYDSVEVSKDELDRIKKRMSKKITNKKAKNNKLSTVGRAAAIVLTCCTVFGGGAAIASSIRAKNTADDYIIEEGETKVVSTETEKTDDNNSNNTIKKVMTSASQDVSINYSVQQEGNDDIEISSISHYFDDLNIEFVFKFDDNTDLSSLESILAENKSGWDATLSSVWDQEMMCYAADYVPEPAAFKGILPIATFLTGEEESPESALCIGHKYSIEGNTLHLNLIVSTDDLEDTNNTILNTCFIFGRPYLKTYNVQIELPEFETIEEPEAETKDISIKSEVENYGATSSIAIDKYSVGVHGLKLFGKYDWETEGKTYDDAADRRAADGVCLATVYHRVRAWDDLGNSYILYPRGIEFLEDASKSKSNEDEFSFYEPTYYVWHIRNNNTDALDNYTPGWDPNATKLTFVVEKESFTEYGEEHDEGNFLPEEYEYVMDPITIDARTGDILQGEAIPDPRTSADEAFTEENKQTGESYVGPDDNLNRNWSDYIHTTKQLHSESSGTDIKYEVVTDTPDKKADLEITNISFSNKQSESGSLTLGFKMNFKEGTDISKLKKELGYMNKQSGEWNEIEEDMNFYTLINPPLGIEARAYFYDYYHLPIKGTTYKIEGDSIYLEMEIGRSGFYFPAEEDIDLEMLVIRLGTGAPINEEYNLIIYLPQDFYDNQKTK